MADSRHQAAHVVVDDLQVAVRRPDGSCLPIVKGVSFAVQRGEVLALIGESGSGKTTTALALMAHARAGCAITGGRVRVGDTEVLGLDTAGLRALRGRRVAYIAQSAAAAFNPSRTLMDQVCEAALVHGLSTRQAAEAKARALFEALALPDAQHIGERYPHQVSGGQLQRVMAAMAFITDPELVIFDEPTTALDVTTQIEVLRAFRHVVRTRGTTAIYVSHDLAVVAQMADRIVVLRQGEVQEAGDTDQILQRPADAYTSALLAAAQPEVGIVPPPQAQTSGPLLLEVRGLCAGYGPVDRHGRPAVPVLDEVGLRLHQGQSIGVIGESGSGKSTLARVIAGLVAPSTGHVLFNGRYLSPTLAGRGRDELRRVQLVFQNADTALNPAHSIEQILLRPLDLYLGRRGPDAQARVAALLDLVQLPRTVLQRRPRELSGGQKQRVNLARALAAEPDLILCDEVTSALDTVVGAAILALLAELRRELGLSYVFISHDIATVRAVCDDVMVMYGGRMVQSGATSRLGQGHTHPYADLLLSSVPELRMGWLDERPPARPRALAPSPRPTQTGCAFAARCSQAIPGVCAQQAPPRHTGPDGGTVLCHLPPAPGLINAAASSFATSLKALP